MESVESPREEKSVYEFFLLSVLAKGAISLVEVVSGTALFFIPPAFIVASATFILSYLPQGHIVSAVTGEVAKYTTGTVTFVALYLLSRGLIKIFLIAALLKNLLWAYPASLVVLALFVIYQGYQIITSHSIIVTAITIFDLVVMYFIWREWRIVLRHRTKSIVA